MIRHRWFTPGAPPRPHLIHVKGLADGSATYHGAPQYLKAVDPDRPATAQVELTTEPGEALRFADAATAWNFFRTTSACNPMKDGKPNQPLTRFVVEIVPVP